MSSLFDPPDPPNPIDTARAQTGTNVATAVANANLSNINQVTPQGSLNYSTTGNYDWTDPATGQTYSIPQFTATQSFTPTGQATFDQSQTAQYNLAALGNEQSARMRNQFSTPYNIIDPAKYLQQNPDVAAAARASGTDPIKYAQQHYAQYGQAEGRASGAPEFGSVSSLTNSPQAQTAFGYNGWTPSGHFAEGDPTSGSFGAAPSIQQGYQHGDDFSADRQRIEEGLLGRINPSLAIERNKYEQQLSDQGILYGSKAYEDAMRNYSMQATDARYGAIAQGGQEQQRLSDIARQAGEFFNKGQQQAFEQAKGRGEFANQAAQQQYEQAFGRGQFYNAGQQQNFSQQAAQASFANAARAQNFQQTQSAFNASNAARQQYLNEMFALRNQPINEISALLSGSQVSQPNFLQTSAPTIPTTDVAGLMNRNFDQQMAASNQQAATANNIIGGLFGFAGGLGRGGAFTGK